MGFWDFLRRSDTSVGYMTPNVEYIGGPEWVERVHDLTGTDYRDASAAQLWRTQPHLRTVVSFLARNVAQLGLHTFERVDETDRRRDRSSPVASALQSPDTNMTGYDLIYATVGDMALYDTAYWALKHDAAGGVGLRRVPPSWVSEVRDNPFEVTGYRVSRNNQQFTIPATEVLSFSGYAPTSPGGVSPTIAALKETLAEQMEASKFRNQVWKRGGRVSAVIERPAGAPEWSPGAMERFREDWYAKYTGNGPRAGGTPILEDGMKLNRIDFSATEQQFVEGAKLSFSTVAAAFHVNPTMVGILDNANYSNVREFRRMLYGDTLGPMLAQIEARVNTLLLPMLGMDADRFYVEFNIAEKLQGSFEEQAAVMSTLVGRPVLTADEARAKFNMPALGGNAAELVTPLNVLVGGQASSRDSAPPPAVESAGPPRQIKAAPKPGHVDKATEVLSGFFTRQQASVIDRIAAGPDWWDGERWDRELSADLLPLSHSIAETIGKVEAERLGYTAAYNGDQTVKFLTEVADRYAKTVNDTTQGQLKAAVAADEDPTHVFDVAKESRAAGVGQMVTTFAAGFGTVEAAKQIAQGNDVAPTKTWVTGSNPRPEHAAMDGQTVPIDDLFSDGNEWPGGVPGCNCSVSVSI